MINPDAKLAETIFDPKIAQKPTRDGFGTGTIQAAKADAKAGAEGKDAERILVLCADLSESTRAEWFQKEFPERFIEMGIGEQNMAATAAGFALAGKIPFMASYAAFSPGRNYEQIRTTIALNRQHVIVCGMHAGVSVGPDGATHQMLEDIGLMRMLPHMTVIAPADAEEARKAVVAAAKMNGAPVYIRFGRSPVPVFTTPDTPFEIGKALVLWESYGAKNSVADSSVEIGGSPLQKGRPKVALMATGSMAYQALLAARALETQGIGSIVLSVPTVKPLDTAAILAAAKKTGNIVTIEEHQVAGGFGSAVAEYVSEAYPVPIKRLGVQDQFGQSGTPEELLAHYGLSSTHIQDAARALLKVSI
jgi:transketolase